MKALLSTLAAVLFIGIARLFANETSCAYESSAFAPAMPDSPEYRKYAPDRTIDIAHMALDVTPDFAERTVAGTVVWTFKPIAKPLSQLKLDAVDLKIAEVTATEKVAGYQATADQLIVTFVEPVPVDREAKVTIRYSASPRRGLYFRTPELGFKADDLHIWTQGEPDEARYWYPCYDYPNEKFTTEVTCHVPEGMVVLSNGRQVSSTNDAQGLVAVRWLQDKPMVNYLVALIAGRFKSIEDKHGKIPLRFWTPASDIAYAKNSFEDTKPAMEFFEKEIGVPYPWDKYDQVCIQDYHWGGMENTTITTLNINTLYPPVYENVRSSQGLIAHELAHQWFGDLLTCKDWSHVWLNEGFASFYELLYTEQKQGRDEFLYRLWEGAKPLIAQTNTTKSIVWRRYGNPNEQFDTFAYGKGAWVLNMLRQQLGPDLFRKCIHAYVERHKFGNVVTDDLRAALEEGSGRSFDQFFDQWVYHSGVPHLDIDYAWDDKTHLAKVSVRQSQTINENVSLFKFPLPVRFKGKFGTTNHVFDVKEVSEDFYLSLPDQPKVVRIDPEVSVLAKINFKPGTPMLLAMLEDKSDVVGRFIACEQLQERKDRETIAKLKTTLNEDRYWGVRVVASKALRAINNDGAFEALVSSMKQSDARVRKQIVMDVTAFYRPEAFEQALSVVSAEKNPDIVGVALRSLDASSATNARATLLRYLKSSSWREHLAETAMSTMRAADSSVFIEPITAMLRDRKGELPSRTLAIGMDAVAYLSREERNKDVVRELIAGFANHPRESVRVAAITALGTLQDESGLPVLERFSTIQKDMPERAAAERAIEVIRQRRPTASGLGELRKEVLELQKQNRELRKEFDAMKAKTEAVPAKSAPK